MGLFIPSSPDLDGLGPFVHIMSGLCCSSDVRSLYLLIGEFVCPAFDMSMIRVSMY